MTLDSSVPVVERFPIEAGHIHTFAAAIGDRSPHFDIAGESMVAPPTFLIAAAHFDPDFPLRPHPERPWPPRASVDGPEGADTPPSPAEGRREPILHAEQHFELRRPIVAGDVLQTFARPGRTWSKTGSRGELSFAETITDYRDATGTLVATTRSVTVRTATTEVER